MAKQFTLGKQERLKSRKIIEKLFSEGKKFTLNPYKVYYLYSSLITAESLFPIQFGVGVSSKIFKKAVDRNRIKRITREAYRLQKIGLQNKLTENKMSMNIFFIYTGKELRSYQEVYEKIKLILNKLDIIISELK